MFKKKMIGSLCVALCLVICLTLTPVSAFGSSMDFSWRLDGSTLYIEGNGAVPDYLKPEDLPWNTKLNDILSIVVNKEVTKVGRYVFAGCPNLIGIVFLGDTKVEIQAVPYGTTTAVNAVIGSHAEEWAKESGQKLIVFPERPADLVSAFANETLPADHYVAVCEYTIDGIAYYGCELMRESNGVAPATAVKGKRFYIDNELHIVSDAETLSKLTTMYLFGDGSKIVDDISRMSRINAQVGSTAIALNDKDTLMKVVGPSGAALVSAAWLNLDAVIGFLEDSLTNSMEAAALTYNNMIRIAYENSKNVEEKALQTLLGLSAAGAMEYNDCIRVIDLYYDSIYYASITRRLCMPVIKEITDSYGSDIEVAIKRYMGTILKSIGEWVLKDLSQKTLKGMVAYVFSDITSIDDVAKNIESIKSTYELVEYYLSKPLDILFTLSDGAETISKTVTGQGERDKHYLEEFELSAIDADNARKPFFIDMGSENGKPETMALREAKALREWLRSGGQYESALTDTITWRYDSYLLELSGSGELPSFPGGMHAPWSGKDIICVVIRQGITAINTNALPDCENAYMVFIAGSVDRIDDGAFEGFGVNNSNVTCRAPLGSAASSYAESPSWNYIESPVLDPSICKHPPEINEWGYEEYSTRLGDIWDEYQDIGDSENCYWTVRFYFACYQCGSVQLRSGSDGYVSHVFGKDGTCVNCGSNQGD